MTVGCCVPLTLVLDALMAIADNEIDEAYVLLNARQSPTEESATPDQNMKDTSVKAQQADANQESRVASTSTEEEEEEEEKKSSPTTTVTTATATATHTPAAAATVAETTNAAHPVSATNLTTKTRTTAASTSADFSTPAEASDAAKGSELPSPHEAAPSALRAPKSSASSNVAHSFSEQPSSYTSPFPPRSTLVPRAALHSSLPPLLPSPDYKRRGTKHNTASSSHEEPFFSRSYMGNRDLVADTLRQFREDEARDSSELTV